MSAGAEDFRARLRRMRREGEGAEPSSPAPSAAPPQAKERKRRELPVWMAAKLRARERRTVARERQSSLESHLDLQPASKEPLRAMERSSNPRGSFSERTTRYSCSHVHGDMRLDSIEEVTAEAFEFFTGDSALSRLRVKDAVFLDTETTGLSGGAGTYVFQVGLGRFRGGVGKEDEFELWQGFMEGPEEEAALLLEVKERVQDSSGVVSFFGKSFDRHRLEDKMRLHGIEPPFADRPHLDLYHPLRRIFRGRFEDGKLRTMENRLCGLDRPDDLPGAFAPAAWFDYIAGRAHRLEGVFQHNADDVLSLVTLAAWLGQALKVPGRDHAASWIAALWIARARGHAERKNWSGCASQAEKGRLHALDDADKIESTRWLARARARSGDWLEALPLWSEVAEHSLGGFADWVEAAKCSERLKEFSGALRCCRAAQRLGGPPGAMRDLEVRMARVLRASER